MSYGYGIITCRKGDYIWGLSSDYTLVWRDDEIQVVMCYGSKWYEKVEDKVDADGDLTESEVLDLAESRGLICRSNEYNGKYRIIDSNRLGTCGCSEFCDTPEEAAKIRSRFLKRYISLSEKLSVGVYKYINVCDRGYYVYDDSFDWG